MTDKQEWYALLRREQIMSDGTFHAKLMYESAMRSEDAICVFPGKFAALLRYVSALEKRVAKLERR